MLGDIVVGVVALSGVVVLLAAVTTSMSGAGRLSYSLARHGMLPHAFERLHRRTLHSPAAIVATAVVTVALIVLSDVAGRSSVILASLYSFGVLFAFTAAQLAVVRLRRVEPDLPRPFRAPGMPFTGWLGAALTAAIFVLSLATHEAARIAGPVWLLAGFVVFAVVRRRRGTALTARVRPGVADIVPSREGEYRRLLVPVKLGPIGVEVFATALRLAEELGASITAVHVVPVPLDEPLDAPLYEEEERAASSLAEAKLLAAEHGVEVDAEVVRARAIGAAVIEQALERDADLIVMGSSPALAAPVAHVRADRRVRPAEGALRGDGDRLPAGGAGGGRAGGIRRGYPARMRAIVVGCGRVGSTVAKTLAEEGWDVTAVDESESALARLGERWRGGFVIGHGMDMATLRQAGIEDADAVVVATDGDNTNIVVAQIAQKMFEVDTVVVRLLDPARADFYAARGLDVVCPTKTAYETLTERVRAARVRS